MRKFRGTSVQLRTYLLELIAEITKFVTSPPKPTSPNAVGNLSRKKVLLPDVKKAIAEGRVKFSSSLPDMCYEDCFFPKSSIVPCPTGAIGVNTIPIAGSIDIKDPLHYVDEIEFTDDRHIIDGEYLDNIVAYHINIFNSLTTEVADATVLLPAKPRVTDLNAHPFIIEPTRDDFPTEVRIPIVRTTKYDIAIGGGGGSGCAIVVKDIDTQQVQVSGGRAGELTAVSMDLVKGDTLIVSFGRGGYAVEAIYDNSGGNPATHIATAGNSGEVTEAWVLDVNGVEKLNSRITALGGAGGLASYGKKLVREVDLTIGFNSGCASVYDNALALPNTIELLDDPVTYMVAHNSENSQFEIGRQCRYYLIGSVSGYLVSITGELLRAYSPEGWGGIQNHRYPPADDSCGGSPVLVGIRSLEDTGAYKAISGYGGQGFCKVWRNGYD